MRKNICIVLIFILISYSLESTPSLNLKSISVQDYSISYYEGGRKPPVFLLVHGLGVTKESFYKMAELLVKKYNKKILLPDIPGQGETQRIKGINYSADNMANFLNNFLAILKIKQVIIIGNSMGGHIATAFALMYPEKVKILILINPAGIQFEDKMPYQPIDLTNFDKEQIIEELRWNNKIREDLRNGKFYPLNDYLSKIKSRTILFWGRDDDIIQYPYSAIWASEIHNVEFYVLKGKHLLQDEVPEQILKRIFKY